MMQDFEKMSKTWERMAQYSEDGPSFEYLLGMGLGYAGRPITSKANYWRIRGYEDAQGEMDEKNS
jgi:hypothetical protein